MSQKDKAIAIIKHLRDAGYESYLAGGCVRDMLLGKTPQDYDITTNAKPDDIVKIFAKTVPVGAQFGVILVMVEGQPFEVASFRHDGPYLDGRRPSHVRYGSLHEDIFRRDFTINGMVYDPIADQIIDRVGGRVDLDGKLIRAIGSPHSRFEEDRLRMIRAVRFAASLDFAVESETFAAIRDLALTIKQISWERIGEEITRILTEGGAKTGFELLDRTGLLQVLLPEISAITLNHLGSPTETLAYGCLLHDVAKPVCIRRDDERLTFYGHTDKGAEMAEEVLKRLKRSRATRERVAYLVRSHLRHMQAPQMRLSTLKRFLGEDGIEELLELTRIDALSANGDLQHYQFCKQKLAELKEEGIHPEPLLRGRDLIAMGFSPGPNFQTILKQVQEAQLGGELSSREEAMDWVNKNYGNEVKR
jgi:poly(A) polymerase